MNHFPKSAIPMWKKICGVALLIAIPLFSLEAISWAVLHFSRGGVKTVQAERAALAHVHTGEREVIRADSTRQFEFVAHPYFGYVQNPGINPVINRHGFVGPDPLTANPLNSYNVVITGGSVAGNFYNLSWDRLRAGLLDLPGFQGKDVNVLSLAVAGYKQPQQLLTLAWMLSRGAKIDLVINIDGYNEVVIGLSKNVPEGASLFYPILWKDLTADFFTPEKRYDLGRLAMCESIRSGLANLFCLFPLDRSMTATLAWSLADSWPRRMQRQAVLDLERVGGALPYFQSGPIESLDEDKARDVLVENWAASSRLMAAMVEAAGGAYLHVLQPNQYVAGSKPLSPDEERYAITRMGDNGRLTRAGYAKLSQAIPGLEASGVLFFDATGVFSNTTETLYYDTCCHFNSKGTTLLCDAILDFLKQTVFASKTR